MLLGAGALWIALTFSYFRLVIVPRLRHYDPGIQQELHREALSLFQSQSCFFCVSALDPKS